MSRIIEVNESIFTPDHKQLTYKLNQARQHIIEAIDGYKMIERNQDVEEGEFLLTNGLAFAKAFIDDSLMISRGPDFIDWM